MNYLVFLDAGAGELEKILSGIKTMLLKEFDPAPAAGQPVSPGDSLYFLRNHTECTTRGKAVVVRVLQVINATDEELSRTLKEMQPRLQLTEEQYNHWSTRQQVLLIEFESAHKIPVIDVAPEMMMDRSDWIPFEDVGLIAHIRIINSSIT
jgi:hypothetical protein